MSYRPVVSLPILAFAMFSALVVTMFSGVTAQRGGGAQQPQPFKGLTADGTIEPGLFPITATGVSTRPVREAAQRFLQALTAEQRAKTTYAVDDEEWLKWNNVHRYARQGVNFEEMTEAQRERAFDLLRASLSAKGFNRSRSVMKLNGHLADLLDRHGEYGEWLYHLTVMGVPSDTEPWGWQLDGHHLIINYFVLGDQVVMTPTFMGSEPVTATEGRYAGTSVMQDEQNKGMAFMKALSADQRTTATIQAAKTSNMPLAHAFRDNVEMPYVGLPGTKLSVGQRTMLLELVGEYVGNMADGHAKVRMEEVRAHLDRTHFAWAGGHGETDSFYYRIHSPVILIEFDHQSPVALPGTRGVPSRAHVHSMVRTPNGNDYGKDLLRQHYEKHANDVAHGHR
ncbi:MAG: DUF3500 domain-containing protein [Acidobacteria bacterium]|nr:DUF3500 domain-containing protein [Acidobacteriota bacterium]